MEVAVRETAPRSLHEAFVASLRRKVIRVACVRQATQSTDRLNRESTVAKATENDSKIHLEVKIIYCLCRRSLHTGSTVQIRQFSLLCGETLRKLRQNGAGDEQIDEMPRLFGSKQSIRLYQRAIEC